MTRQVTEAEPQTASYGFDISSVGLRGLRSLLRRAAYQFSRWIASAPARRRRGVDWEAASGSGANWQLCPANQLIDAERLGLLVRIDRPPCDVPCTTA
ncbi:hypothetical protein WKI65_43400 [Streptomyces sp. MS1.AVA.3]|uniref:hypothetical protein n=1 Tax=Streptomyces decoyicus TaxID=249567 RepID=UPI0030C1B48A